MEILYQGAESIIYLDNLENQKVLVKERIKKNYRIEKLDERLRKSRTKKEVKLLTELRKIGINTPKIFQVDEKNYKIFMEYVDGERLKEYLNSVKTDKIKPVCKKLGMLIGKLHSNNITHGDLTTSNIILKDGEIYFIDVSLGDFTQRVEDKGIDLKLLKEALKSTHFKIFDVAWESILKGYKAECKDADIILRQLEKIEKRARYTER